MSLKSIIAKIPLIAFLSIMVMFKMNAFAADTVWQNDYEYRLYDPDSASGNIDGLKDRLIKLIRYHGNATTIKFPATAIVNGKTYKTAISSSKAIPFFNNASKIESISCENGCILGSGTLLTNCTNLKTLDLTGFKNYYSSSPISIITDDCQSLEYINFSGTYFSGSRNSLINCKSLKKISTPANMFFKERNNHEKTLLPYAMFEYKDGSYIGKPYLYLDDAPPNTLLAAKDSGVKTDKSIIKYNGLKYKVLSSGKKEVELIGPVKKCPSKVIVDDTICDENGTLYYVKSIRKKAFYRNKQLKKLEIYNDGITIKSKAFADCPKLKEVYIEDHNAVLKSQAFKSSGIKKVTFYGAYVFTIDLIIGKEAFKDCTKLSEIVFDGLWRMNMKKTIKKNCFKGIKSKAMVRFTGAEGPGLPLEHFKDFHPKGKAIVKYINKFGGASDAKPKLPTG